MRKFDRINALPEELLLEIFKHVDGKDNRDACALVCKKWVSLERLSRDTICFGSSESPDYYVNLLIRRFVNIQHVIFDERTPVSLSFFEMDIIFGLLDSKFSRDSCSLVCRRWLRLENLSRSAVQFGTSGWTGSRYITDQIEPTDNMVRLFVGRFVNVQSVTINELLVSNPSVLDKRRRLSLGASNEGMHGIETTCLSDSGLAAVGDGFSKLEKLTLIWCSTITNLGLRSFAEKCRSLKSLDLQGCFIGDEGLAAVGEFCKCLEHLNLRFIEGLTDIGLVQLVLGCGSTLKSLGVAACAKITDFSLEAVGSHCLSLESLSLDSDVTYNKGFIAVAKGCRMLKLLKLQCVNISDDALEAVGLYCFTLESLALYNFQNFTESSLKVIGKGCKMLKNIMLSDCYFLSDASVEYVAAGCRELTHIEINGCHKIGSEGLKSIGKFCSRLSELSLLYCQKIDNSALTGIGEGCKFLQSLHLVDCSGIGDESLCCIAKGCRSLKKLHIRRCYEVGNKGIAAIGENCRFLTDLSLRFCDRVGDDALISVAHGCSLHHLNVSGCHQIGDAGIIAIARNSPRLVSLDVSVLQNLSDKAIMQLGKGCPLLKDLVISHCRRITNVGIFHLVEKCTLLESCHMVYCPGISDVGVATMVTGFTKLRKVLVEKWKVSERTKRRTGNVITYLNLDF